MDWLLEFFPDHWTAIEGPFWNDGMRCVEWRNESSCLGVMVDRVVGSCEGKEAASVFLAKMIGEKNLKIKSWDKQADAYMARIDWVGSLFPEKNLVSFGADGKQKIVESLCLGEFRYGAVKNKPILPAIQNLLGANVHFVEQMAPERIDLPSGWKMPVKYETGKPPTGRARIQDLYDLKETPKVAGGRASLLLEILAPNNRAVQVTDDLAGFWINHYPELKKTLSRRYYKHEWR